MMRFWGAVACLVALPALAGGQSLGDAAKKERERRDKLRQAGSSARTLTQEDLATTKARLANDPNQPVAGEKGEASKQPARESPGGRNADGPEAASPKGGEEYWRGRVAQARGRVAAAQRRYDAFQRMIRLGQPGAYDENGNRVIYSIYQMKEKADAAAAELASAQAALENVLEEGRRAGAQPGWLR